MDFISTKLTRQRSTRSLLDDAVRFVQHRLMFIPTWPMFFVNKRRETQAWLSQFFKTTIMIYEYINVFYLNYINPLSNLRHFYIEPIY